MDIQVKEPIIIVGIGSAGYKLASQAGNILGADVLAVSNDQADLQAEASIRVSTAPVVNPTVQLIRGSSYKVHDDIRDKISGYATVILMANLAGKAGAALAPTISQICKDADKNVISFAIMPFKYEKNRIFSSGVALKRLREYSGCTIVMDNDALLENNPNLSPNSCFEVANKAILYVVDSLKTSAISQDTSILTTGTNNSDMEESLKGALKMLYDDAPPDAIKSSMLYVSGGNNIPVGILNSIGNLTRGVLRENNSQVDLESTSSEESKVVMLSTIQGMTKFDSYDPLGVIPQENTLDWSEPESSIGCKLDLYQLE